MVDLCVVFLKVCDFDDFFNLYIFFKIVVIFFVIFCECECLISIMRRLNNYMRCIMGESRFFLLVFMYIKYDMFVDLDEIVNLF